MGQVEIANNLFKENTNPYAHSLYPTKTTPQPAAAENRSNFGHAAVSILPKMSSNAKNKMMWGGLDPGASSHFLFSATHIINK